MNEDQLKEELTAMGNAITSTTEAPLVLNRTATSRIRRRRVVAAATATACVAAAVGLTWTIQSDKASREAPSVAAPPVAVSPSAAAAAPVTLGEGLERFNTSTADDWVAVADRVIVGTVTSEREMPPTKTEIARGEGLLGRTVTLTVGKTVWSRAGAAEIPATITLSTAGVTFSGGVDNNRHRLAYPGASRLEVGHRYVLAIYYQSAGCDGENSSARWAGIGSGGVIPFDTATLGTGEIEGRSNVVVPEATGGSGVLRAQLKGKSLDDLQARLDAATGRARPSATSC
ncbi:MAG TPA: hypothetical protein VLL08_13055 [Kineosporiaceae bacterium]|nr:hypothetical protein [Kineosporiaceae bacterium]